MGREKTNGMVVCISDYKGRDRVKEQGMVMVEEREGEFILRDVKVEKNGME